VLPQTIAKTIKEAKKKQKRSKIFFTIRMVKKRKRKKNKNKKIASRCEGGRDDTRSRTSLEHARQNTSQRAANRQSET
jgi:hypothetical protein